MIALSKRNKIGWIHPENECPGDAPREVGDPILLPLEGTCNEPSCDIAEFYKMVLFLLLGMGEENDPNGPEVWLSESMPGRQDEVSAILSDEFKEMITDPGLHQLRAPITGEYNVSVASDVPEPPTTSNAPITGGNDVSVASDVPEPPTTSNAPITGGNNVSVASDVPEPPTTSNGFVLKHGQHSKVITFAVATILCFAF